MIEYLFDKITTMHFVILASIVFTIGACGLFINRKSVITVLMSIELMLLSVNINLVAFSVQVQNYVGQVFSVFVLTVAAAEAAIGLAILVAYYRNKNSVDIADISDMRG